MSPGSAENQGKLVELEAQRKQHHVQTLRYVLDLLERLDLKHVLIITQVPGCDIAVHSSWSSKVEELWLLARAQHLTNRVLDGDEVPWPRDDNGAG